MNQDEAWIGKVMVAGLIIFAVWIVQAILTAKSEGAKRLRIVLGSVIALGVASVWFAMAGPVGFVITLGVIAAGVWVFKGFKK